MIEVDEENESAPKHPGLALSTALLSSSRALEYGLAGVTGLVLARVLGPDGRGLYSLITEAGPLVYAPVGLGIATAGVYLSNQRRFSQQAVFSNSVAWLLGCFAIYALGATILLTQRDEVFGLGILGVAVIVTGGVLALFRFAFRDFLAAQGRMVPLAMVDLVFPIVRLSGVLLLFALAFLDTEAAVLCWLAALGSQMAWAGFLLSRRLSLRPNVDFAALRQQISYGARSHAGWLLQNLNHRFDVFILGYFSGSAAVGYYAVAFNLAEMAWWMPLALGTALFPQAASLSAADNATLTASVIRRALPLTLMVTLGMLVIGQPLIILLYGRAFDSSVAPFLILAPSGLFYTVHKLLQTSLVAQGKPQASLYGGLISVPVMIGANLILVPRFDAVGAAIASNVAYALYAAYLAWYFRRATGVPLREVLLPGKQDLTESVLFARETVGRLVSRITTARRSRSDSA